MVHHLFSFGVLRFIWWALLAYLIIGYAIMDGFDLGVAILLPFVAKKDTERRVVINTVGPVWEGNQVWLILGGGMIFAAWPTLYAVSFSSFYFAMLLLLAMLILRPVAFKYRSKLPSLRWRFFWDKILFLTAFVSALVFGVAIGNVLQGIPFHFDFELRSYYTGSFYQLFNPFALLCGVLSVVMLTMHGGLYLAIKTEGVIQKRANRFVKICALLVIILFGVGGYWVAFGIKGYLLAKPMIHYGPSNPVGKMVTREVGAWCLNFTKYHILIILPVLGFLGSVMAFLFTKFNKFSFFNSSLSIIGIIGTVGVSMFPFLLPSSSNPGMSLLVWDASSSHMTLGILLFVAVIFIPIILIYTSWVYHVLKGKINEEEILNDHMSY